MNPLFTKNSLMILESLSFTKTLYAFDFDGTLSKIVKNPSQATISHTTESLLRELSRLAPVAIISGRSLSDLKSKLSFRPQFLIGNQGLEGLDDHHRSLSDVQKVCSDWKKHLISTPLGQGIEIEDKVFSIAIHFRNSRQKTIAKSNIHKCISSLLPAPRVITGKSVINIVPPGSPHKGFVLLKLMEKTGARNAFYIGDDDTDEDVFALTNSNIMTVRVGQKKTSFARYYIDRQAQMNQLIKLMIAYHEPRKRPLIQFRVNYGNA